jgi:hypothetical protein
MLSSISSSNSRLPHRQWAQIWVLAIMLFFLVIVLFEGTYRYKGYQPSVRDDSSLWSLNRMALKAHDKNAIALIGSSRTECDIQLDEFQAVYGVKPVQLAIISSSPVPVLKHFAEDENFVGTIICEVSPTMFYSGKFLNSPNRYVSKYHSFKNSPFASYDKKFVASIQNHVTALSSQLQLEDFLLAVLKQKWPHATNNYRPDRNRQYHKNITRKRKPDVDIPETPAYYQPITPEAEKIINDSASYVASIRKRGGEVVFAYYNCRGGAKHTEIFNYPDVVYWDTLIRKTGAKSIHSAKHPRLAEFIPDHDHSHLDYKQAQIFTKIFAEIFKERMENK